MSTSTYPLHTIARTVCPTCKRELPLTVAYFVPSALARAERLGRARCRDCDHNRRARHAVNAIGRTVRQPAPRATTSPAVQQMSATDASAAEYAERFRAALAAEYTATDGETVRVPGGWTPADRWMLAYSHATTRTALPALRHSDAEVLRGKVYADLRAAV